MTRVPLYACWLVLLSLMLGLLPAQQATSSAPPTEGKLPAGKSVKDSKGREVRNLGENGNGSVKLKHTGKLQRNTDGTLTCTGEITEVINPGSQGSEGPIEVNTNGEPTTITLDRNGTDPGGHITTNVTGGHATINVTGNHNDVNVGGGSNTANLTGNHNTGNGQPGSSGTVVMGGRGNSWTSGGGAWRTTN